MLLFSRMSPKMYTSDDIDKINTIRGLSVEKVGAIMATTETMHEKQLGDLKIL